jgi:hypothetical protein
MRRKGILWPTALLLTVACHGAGNPVLGEWEIEPAETSRGAVLAVEATDLERLSFRADAIASEGTEIPRMRPSASSSTTCSPRPSPRTARTRPSSTTQLTVELPIGAAAVYRRVGG